MHHSSRRRTGGLISAVAIAAAVLVAVSVPAMAGAAPVPDPSNTNPTVDVSAPVPDPEPTATLAGESLMAQPLTVTTTGWPAGTDFTYEWFRDDGRTILGQTSSMYLPGFADYQKVVKARVTGWGSWGSRTVVTNGSDPIVSEDNASLVVGALSPSDEIVPGMLVMISTSDGGLQAEAETSFRGVAIFQGLPADQLYAYTLFDDDRVLASGHGVRLAERDETLRRVVVTTGLQRDSRLGGTFTGGSGSLGVFTGPGAFSLDDEIDLATRDDARPGDGPLTAVELRLSLLGGVVQTVPLIRTGSRWDGTLDLDQTPQQASLAVVRTYDDGEEYATFDDLAIVEPSSVTDEWGAPLRGADVTLEWSDSEGGPFTAVGTEHLLAGTDVNPRATDAQGQFGFLVAEPRKWFRATATIEGVTASSAVVQGPFAAGALSIVVDRAAVADPSATQLAATGPDTGPWALGGLLLLAGAALIVARRSHRRA